MYVTNKFYFDTTTEPNIFGNFSNVRRKKSSSSATGHIFFFAYIKLLAQNTRFVGPRTIVECVTSAHKLSQLDYTLFVRRRRRTDVEYKSWNVVMPTVVHRSLSMQTFCRRHCRRRGSIHEVYTTTDRVFEASSSCSPRFIIASRFFFLYFPISRRPMFWKHE